MKQTAKLRLVTLPSYFNMGETSIWRMVDLFFSEEESCNALRVFSVPLLFSKKRPNGVENELFRVLLDSGSTTERVEQSHISRGRGGNKISIWLIWREKIFLSFFRAFYLYAKKALKETNIFKNMTTNWFRKMTNWLSN